MYRRSVGATRSFRVREISVHPMPMRLHPAPVTRLRPTSGLVPPHNLDAEAAVLSSVFIAGSGFEAAAGIIQAEHFYSDANRRIFEAMAALAAATQPIDVVTVATWLLANGRLNQVGGTPYLAQIQDSVPAVANIASYAEIVRDAWQKRELIARCQMIAAEAYDTPTPSHALIQSAEASLGELSAIRHSRWRSLGDVARTMGDVAARVTTSISELDALCGGGLTPGSLTVVGGAPGAGKTTLCVQLALAAARDGASVRWLAYDEAERAIISRLLQMVGVARAHADCPDEPALHRLATELGSLDIRLRDASVPLDGAAASWEVGGPRVLIIDSLQTAHTLTSPHVESPRQRVDAVLTVLRRIAAMGVIVIVTSELARGAYRSRVVADSTEPLAAPKESGGIEYAATLLLVLRSVAGSSDLVHVDVPKCRLGRTGELTLRLDRERCLFALAAGGSADAERAAHDAKVDALATRAVELLRRHHPRTTGELRGELRCGHPILMAALGRLVQAGAVRNGGHARRSDWSPVTRSSTSTESEEATQ
ncbi:MAG TPA: DnaB-like helicase N-terminal domain-containing protein [Polyangiaceae bacterium]|nr:DnaB-like helicase N-terminal domain-containing protein [Polyangiaceae bacterium]